MRKRYPFWRKYHQKLFLFATNGNIQLRIIFLTEEVLGRGGILSLLMSNNVLNGSVGIIGWNISSVDKNKFIYVESKKGFIYLSAYSFATLMNISRQA